MHSVLHKANVERSARVKQQTLQQQQQQQYQLQLQQQQYSLQQEQCKILDIISINPDQFQVNFCKKLFYLESWRVNILHSIKETAYE